MRCGPVLAFVLFAACDGASGGARSSSSASSSTSASASSSGGGADGGQGGATGACASCDGACVDLASDPRHCGGCGHACAARALCDRGTCAKPLCLVQGLPCPNDHLCCGDACCPPWKMCCNAPDAGAPICVPLDAGACPTTCAGCL